MRHDTMVALCDVFQDEVYDIVSPIIEEAARKMREALDGYGIEFEV